MCYCKPSIISFQCDQVGLTYVEQSVTIRDFHVGPGPTQRCNSGSRWALFAGNEPHDCSVWYLEMMEAKGSQARPKTKSCLHIIFFFHV